MLPQQIVPLLNETSIWLFVGNFNIVFYKAVVAGKTNKKITTLQQTLHVVFNFLTTL